MIMTEETKQEIENKTNDKTSKKSPKKDNANNFGMPLRALNFFIILFLIVFGFAIHKGMFNEQFGIPEKPLETAHKAQVSKEESAQNKDSKVAEDSEWVTPHISKQVKTHILYGDEMGGAHFHTVKTPCKSIFPESWGPNKIIEVTEKIAANDNLEWKSHKNGNIYAQTIEDDILVRVVMDAERQFVKTSYPLNAGRTPCPKDDNAAITLPKEENEVINSAEGTSLYNILDGVDIEVKHRYDLNE
jgi:hypothetical protein